MAVYFIQAGEGGPVKIGTTHASIEVRLRGLQPGCPFELKVLRVIEGGTAAECWLHRHFLDLHIRSEWFRYSPEMETVSLPKPLPAVRRWQVRADMAKRAA